MLVKNLKNHNQLSCLDYNEIVFIRLHCILSNSMRFILLNTQFTIINTAPYSEKFTIILYFEYWL